MQTQRGAGDRVHRSLYHLLDVGQVALLVWQRVTASAAQRTAASCLDMDEDATGRFLAFVAALHDLGKASPAYQNKYIRFSPDALRVALGVAGLRLEKYGSRRLAAPRWRPARSALGLEPLLRDEMGVHGRFARKLARAVGGDYGAWPSPSAVDGIDDDAEWADVRARLFAEVRGVFGPTAPVVSRPVAQLNAFLTWFSGFVSVADWLGSIDDYNGEEFFPFEDGHIPTACYGVGRRSRPNTPWPASVGWAGSRTAAGRPSPRCSRGTPEPRPVQHGVIAAGQAVQPPALLILEAPTGIGKTEAALYLADTLAPNGWRQWPDRGHADDGHQQPDVRPHAQLPCRPLSSRPDQPAHRSTARRRGLAAVKFGWRLLTTSRTMCGRVAAMAWFNQQKKRTLLAPFGVGTVDQSLLAGAANETLLRAPVRAGPQGRRL